MTRIRQELFRKRQAVLSLPPEKAMDRILEERQAAPLVHSFPEEDFYFLIHEIGADDALDLLGLASSRQWEYILDAEIWEKDQPDLAVATKWLNRLIKADPGRLVRWLAEEKTDFIRYYLSRNLQVAIREHDQDPADLGEGFFTDDDVFYFRFTGTPFAPENPEMETETETPKSERDEFLWAFLKRLSVEDHILYQNLILESTAVIPVEAEEEDYRLRNVRRAEKGFLPFEEAIGVYQPLKPEHLKKRWRSRAEKRPADPAVPVPLYAAGMLERDNLFVDALAEIDHTELLQALQTEFAALSNQVIAADQRIIREREELKGIVRKVCGYLSIGMRRLTGEGQNPSPNQTAELIRQYPLSQIFRVGYGMALELKWRAGTWHRESWFARAGLSLHFWDEEWLGILGGLLLQRPLFFDNYESGVLYREFRSVEDIRRAADVLDAATEVDALLSRMDMAVTTQPERVLTWKNLLLTLWARNRLGMPEVIAPVPLADFRPFYTTLWQGELPERTLVDAARTDFINWIAGRVQYEAEEVTACAGKAVETLFQELESEYHAVAAGDIDPRYLHLFLIS